MTYEDLRSKGFSPNECDFIMETIEKELNLYKKAFELLAKDYCESMGCSFCDHRAKCLEANHFEDVDGKEFLQNYFLSKARKEVHDNDKKC